MRRARRDQLRPRRHLRQLQRRGLVRRGTGAGPTSLRERLQIVSARHQAGDAGAAGTSASSTTTPRRRRTSSPVPRSSLRALRIERLELLLIHRPDALMDADEVAAFRGAARPARWRTSASPTSRRRSSSCWPAARRWPPTRSSCTRCSAPLADGTLDQLQRLRIRPMIWSPLAGGARAEPARAKPSGGAGGAGAHRATPRLQQRDHCLRPAAAPAQPTRAGVRLAPHRGVARSADALRITLDAQD